MNLGKNSFSYILTESRSYKPPSNIHVHRDMHASFWLAVGGGIAVLSSYAFVKFAVTDFKVWWGPLHDHKKEFAALTVVTIAAYATVVQWIIRAHQNEPRLWWAVAGFNWSAVLWAPATAFDARFGKRLATISVFVTAGFNIAWATVAGNSKYDAPVYVWCAFAVLLFHHIGVDACFWGSAHWNRKRKEGTYKHTDKLVIKAQHALCATLHLGSAIFIWIKAKGNNFDRPIKETVLQNQWKYSCGPDNTCEECDVDERGYYIEAAGTTHTVPVIRFAVMFAAWSGVWHVASFLLCGTSERKTNVLCGPIAIRTIDYAVSASLMIVVVNTLFGAATPFGAVVAPILQAIIVLVGGGLEAFGFSSGEKHELKVLVLALLMATYAVVWTPAFQAMRDATTESSIPCTAAAPGFVIVFLAVIFIIFSAFPLVWMYYAYNFYFNFKESIEHNREFTYNIISCIAKVTLHAFLSISLFGMNSRLGYSEDSADTSTENAQEGQAYIAATGVIVVVCFLNWLLVKYIHEDTVFSDTMLATLLF
jgi:hypothetical protein